MPKKPEGYGAWLKLDKPEHIVGFLLKSLQHTLRQSMEEALRKRGFELSFAHFVALFGEIMFSPLGALDRREREMIAAVAAAAQDCHY